jgi:putative transposase
LRAEVRQAVEDVKGARLTAVLAGLGIAASTWYRQAVPTADRKRPGPLGKPISAEVERWVVTMAVGNPWYGYKRIAVMCRRAGQAVTNRQAYRVMKQHDLLVKRQPVKAAVYQAAKLWELLPQGPNDLWQMDVTYVHIPGHGWWYVITVIDYYSRYLLAAYLTSSYSAAESIEALGRARREAERIHGPLSKTPFLVTDNGPSFVAKRFGRYIKDVYSHVRIQYRTPTQLGLLERFHCTLKQEEVYWRLYESPAHARDCLAEFRSRYNTKRPHWALVPASGGDPLTPEEVYAEGRATQIPRWQAWARRAKAELERLLEEVA